MATSSVLQAELGDSRPSSPKPLATRAYVVAILPRTGSTALCSLLEQTGVLGLPDEYLNPRGPLQHWARQLGATDLTSYLDVVRRERATSNGIFGVKASYNDFEPFVEPRLVSDLLGPTRFVYPDPGRPRSP